MPSAMKTERERFTIADSKARQFLEATATRAGTPLFHVGGHAFDMLRDYIMEAMREESK